MSSKKCSSDQAGLARIANLLDERLRALGFKTKRHKSHADVGADTVVGIIAGSGRQWLMLMAHMDTVYGTGVLATQPYRMDGNKLVPGTEAKVSVEILRPGFKATEAGYEVVKLAQSIQGELRRRQFWLVPMAMSATDTGYARRSGKAAVAVDSMRFKIMCLFTLKIAESGKYGAII